MVFNRRLEYPSRITFDLHESACVARVAVEGLQDRAGDFGHPVDQQIKTLEGEGCTLVRKSSFRWSSVCQSSFRNPPVS